MTLKDAIAAKRCRTGESYAITKKGAYWLASDPVKIRSFGGSGIGNDGCSQSVELQLRHYRDGTIDSVLFYSCWHQNGPDIERYQSVSDLLDCTTVEEVIVLLKGTRVESKNVAAYSDYYEDDLTEMLKGLGLDEFEAPPDEPAVALAGEQS